MVGGYHSLTGKLEVEGGETDSIGLENATWVGHVHVEGVFAHSAKLHVDVVVVVLVNQLEVLHTGLVYPPIEV